MDLLGAYEEEDGSDASPAAQIGGQDAAGCSQGGGGGDEHAVETEGESSLLDLLGGAGADDGGGALAAAAAGVHAGVLDRLKRADSPGTPSGEAPSDLSSPASSVPHGETGLNECCTPAAQPSGGAGADAHGWGDVDLPAAPVGSVDAVVQANVERLAAQVSACGACGRALVRCERVLLHHDVGLKCTTPPAAETGGRYQHRPARQERIPQPRHS